MNRKLDYIIIGAQKSGTTTLHDLLVQHPRISTSTLKEQLYFSKDSEYNKGEKYFNKLFKSDIPSNNIIGTSDVQLLHSKKGVQRVFEYNPNIKLIVILRNPVDRAYSAFNYAIQKEILSNDISFELLFNEFLKFDLSNYSRNPDEPFDYFYDGFYYMHLSKWLKFFDKRNIFVCTISELKSNPESLLISLFKFLNLDNCFIDYTNRSNETGKYRFSKVQKILFNGNNKIITFLGSLVPVNMKLWIRKYIIHKIRKSTLVKINIAPIDIYLKDEITKVYSKDLKALESEFNINLFSKL